MIFTDYPEYSTNFANYGAEVKYEDGEEKKFRPPDEDRHKDRENGGNNGGQQSYEEGEYDDRDYR